MSEIEESGTWLRIFAAISYTVLSTISLSANLLLLVVFIVGHKRFDKMSYFIISWQTLVCDLIMLSYQFIQAIPTTFAARQLYSPTVMHYMGVLDTIGYNGVLFFMFILTISRFTIFFFEKIDRIVFNPPGIYAAIVFVWVLTLMFTAILNMSGCVKEFTTEGYHIFQLCETNWSVIPSEDTTVSLQDFLNNFHYYTANYLPYLSLICYIIIFIELKLKITSRLRGLPIVTSQSKSFKEKFSILIQSGIICSIFVIENLLYFLPTGRGLQFTTIAQTWADITLHTIHAIVIFSFNSLAKKILKEIIINHQIPSLNSINPTMFVKTLPSKIRISTVVKLYANIKTGNMHTNANR